MGQPVPPITTGIGEPEPLLDAEYAHRPLLVERPRATRNSLNRMARAIGSTAGMAVTRARHLPSRIEELKEEVAAGARRSRAESSDKTGEITNRAERNAREMGQQLRRYSRQNPFTTLGVAGIAGLVLGFGLRLWRDHRE